MDRNFRSGAMKKIPLSCVFLNEEIREAAMRVLESGSYILTKECEAFEAELADHTGTKHAVLCSSWTAAVFLLHHAMGVQAGDEVLVPSHTAFPSIEPMIHWGAKPVFIDIDETYCLDVDLLEAAITPRTVGNSPGSSLRPSRKLGLRLENRAQTSSLGHRRLRAGSRRAI